MTLAGSLRWPNQSMDLGADMERMTLEAAEESLCQYCKPVELYNIIQRRSLVQPLFLQRSLSYKIEAARAKRTKLTIATVDSLTKQAVPTPYSVFVQVTSAPQDVEKDGYWLKHTSVLAREKELIFLLPEFRKLNTHSTKENSYILFIIIPDSSKTSLNSLASYTGRVYWGKLALSTVCGEWIGHLRSMNGNIGFNGTKMISLFKVQMEQGNLQVSQQYSQFQNEESADGRRMKLVCSGNASNTDLPPLLVQVSGEEHGRVANQVSNAVQRKMGRTFFHYLYFFNKLRKVEATERFTCSFCLVRCSSYKGLRCHLDAYHDRFSFEYSEALEDDLVVTVTCKIYEGMDCDLDYLHDPRLKSFFYCSNRIQRNTESQNLQNQTRRPTEHMNGVSSRKVDEQTIPSYKDSTSTSGFGAVMHLNGEFLRREVPLRIADDLSQMPEFRRKLENAGSHAEEARSTSQQDDRGKGKELLQEDYRSKGKELLLTGIVPGRFSFPLPKKQPVEDSKGSFQRQSRAAEKVSGSVIRAGASGEGAVSLPLKKKIIKFSSQRVEKKRKVPSERAEARNRALLQKRQFFHAHTGQPMSSEQVLLDKDSEDELDDTIASWEDRRMLDDFVDVTKDEKDVMHRWNDFVRRERIIADGHCPWACEAFAKLHARDFSKSESLRRCFMLMLVKFWNHQLIDGRVMDQCLSIVDSWGAAS